MKKPNIKNLTATSVGILNTIREGASPDYKSGVPLAVETTESIRQVGEAIMGYQSRQNEFLSALYNRIALVIVTSKAYTNPWAMFKRGVLEYGETIEEIFVNLAKPFQFDPATAESKLFKREMPDVKSAFHAMNYQKFYKVTISDDQLRQAFLSWNGVTDLIARIVDSLYTSSNYDEFITMKYMLARLMLDGKIKAVTIPTVNASNVKGIVSTIKTASNDFAFLSGDYNMAGVKTLSNKEDQFVIKTTDFDAIVDVEVLALAFNMDRAEFAGQQVLIDGFEKLDTDRLGLLFADDPTYEAFTSAELDKLATVKAMIVDRDFFMIYDNLMKFTENYNGEGLYWQYFYHVWKTFSASPFANAELFSTSDNAVSSVTVSPATATVVAGTTAKFEATIAGTGFVGLGVKWSIDEDAEDSYIDAFGILHVGKDETAESITVTATSETDSTKSGTATVTIAKSKMFHVKH